VKKSPRPNFNAQSLRCPNDHRLNQHWTCDGTDTPEPGASLADMTSRSKFPGGPELTSSTFRSKWLQFSGDTFRRCFLRLRYGPPPSAQGPDVLRLRRSATSRDHLARGTSTSGKSRGKAERGSGKCRCLWYPFEMRMLLFDAVEQAGFRGAEGIDTPLGDGTFVTLRRRHFAWAKAD
jgi:hypothetical protein